MSEGAKGPRSVLLFPSLALGDTVEWDDLVEREGLYYEKFTDIPFTGEVTGQRQGQFKDGLREGPWVSYHENGQLWMKGDHKNGEWDGPWVYYWDNGQLRTESNYKDGELDGPWVYYHENGQLWEKGDFKDGFQEGPWVVYNKDGTKNDEESGTYRNGEKVSD